jgi:lysophospholipase L1-like esterase
MAKVPALTLLIDQRSEKVTRLSGDVLGPVPDIVLINLGENGVPADKDVVDALVKIRSRAGKASRIVVMVPVSGRGQAEISRAFNSYKNSTADNNAYLVNLGRIKFAACDGQHPTAAGHQDIYKAVLPEFDRILAAK